MSSIVKFEQPKTCPSYFIFFSSFLFAFCYRLKLIQIEIIRDAEFLLFTTLTESYGCLKALMNYLLQKKLLHEFNNVLSLMVLMDQEEVCDGCGSPCHFKEIYTNLRRVECYLSFQIELPLISGRLCISTLVSLAEQQCSLVQWTKIDVEI